MKAINIPNLKREAERNSRVHKNIAENNDLKPVGNSHIQFKTDEERLIATVKQYPPDVAHCTDSKDTIFVAYNGSEIRLCVSADIERSNFFEESVIKRILKSDHED